jgi:hypothetical protein
MTIHWRGRWKPLNNLLRDAIASLHVARNLAYLFDMSWLLRAVRLTLTPLATVLQRFPKRQTVTSYPRYAIP